MTDSVSHRLKALQNELIQALADEETERTTDTDYDADLAYKAKMHVIAVAAKVADALTPLIASVEGRGQENEEQDVESRVDAGQSRTGRPAGSTASSNELASAGDILCQKVDVLLAHQPWNCEDENCRQCPALFNQVRLAHKVWASSTHKAVTRG
jgi:hypothetical protein